MPAKSRKSRPKAAATLRSNPDESPLLWLARRRDKNGEPLISGVQLVAGEKLRTDFTFAQMMPSVTTNYSGVIAQATRRSASGASAVLRDSVVAAAERVRRALSAVGPELADVLIDVCCYCKGLEEAERRFAWPQRAGKVVLQLALTSLARHYGIETPGLSKSTGRIGQWGAADYRPHFDPDAAQL